jgi:hypothetical protein
MRRGVNPQIAEYVQNGELICFGVSDHTVAERSLMWTDKAAHDLSIVSIISILITETYCSFLL